MLEKRRSSEKKKSPSEHILQHYSLWSFGHFYCVLWIELCRVKSIVINSIYSSLTTSPSHESDSERTQALTAASCCSNAGNITRTARRRHKGQRPLLFLWVLIPEDGAGVKHDRCSVLTTNSCIAFVCLSLLPNARRETWRPRRDVMMSRHVHISDLWPLRVHLKTTRSRKCGAEEVVNPMRRLRTYSRVEERADAELRSWWWWVVAPQRILFIYIFMFMHFFSPTFPPMLSLSLSRSFYRENKTRGSHLQHQQQRRQRSSPSLWQDAALPYRRTMGGPLSRVTAHTTWL